MQNIFEIFEHASRIAITMFNYLQLNEIIGCNIKIKNKPFYLESVRLANTEAQIDLDKVSTVKFQS